MVSTPSWEITLFTVHVPPQELLHSLTLGLSHAGAVE